ncbi:amidohydrolase family protein [Brytella acorum]|uniref:Amidohydrolase family protein n=1 Tax=Brytella acorum TaxID=2959299 RepID=A0AA35Y3Z0_9PROT|nr:amidohydrolase family protein [Brytella acorum]CAI9121316.1 amidohydrolase family protein [Brytella acorum]
MSRLFPVIDLHAHWFPPSTLDILGRRAEAPRIGPQGEGLAIWRTGAGAGKGGAFPLGPQWYDVDARLAHLDAVEIAHQLVSWPTTLGVDAALPAEKTLDLWTQWNNDTSALVRRHPDRFSAVAALSTSDLAWSARELARGHEKLGLIGGVLPVNGFFSRASAEQFRPLFEVAQAHRSHIYLHTGFANPVIAGQPPNLVYEDNDAIRWVIDNGFHFASAVTTLAFTDFLAAFPDVTLQIAMLGGSGLGALAAEQAEVSPRIQAGPLRQHFRQIWLDTGAAGSGTAAVAAAIRVLGSERVVFGSDYAPLPDIRPTLQRVRAATAHDPDSQNAVLSSNALGLLGRHDGLSERLLSHKDFTS